MISRPDRILRDLTGSTRPVRDITAKRSGAPASISRDEWPRAHRLSRPFALMAAVFMLANPAAFAQNAGTTPAPTAKGVLATADRIQFEIEADKAQFSVNEDISLRLRLSQPAFVYLYSQSADGMSHLLYPTTAAGEQFSEGRHRLRHFLSADSAGPVAITAFATRQPLALAALIGPRGAPTKVFEEGLAALGVNVGPKASADLVAGFSAPKLLTLWIGDRHGQTVIAPADPTPDPDKPAVEKPRPDKPTADNPGPDKPVVAAPSLSTDKRSYKLGDEVTITLGSAQAGFAHLFIAYPDGTLEEVGKRKFDAPGAIALAAQATKPAGEQVLVAVYSADGSVDLQAVRMALKAAPDGLAGKGLAIRDKAGTSLPVATYAFKIEE